MTDLFTVLTQEQEGKEIYTVSRLNFEVASLLSGSLPAIWITGEISNLATPPSGHWYFSLKDARAQVRCAMFKGKNRSVNFKPENGAQVLLRATVGLYENRGDFQLNVQTMQPAGDGALQQKFEALKKELQEKGWFYESHKKPLPKLPQTVGIITSKDGAAIHDILTTFKRRFPAIDLMIYPTLVQGKTAAKQIAKMIALANQRKECDVLIVGRGGGSLEDLWAFNEQVVAQAIFVSDLPIVCAVGHESDISIADLVADSRAATPTAAAEALSPEQSIMQQRFTGIAIQLHQAVQHSIKTHKQALQLAQARLPHPQSALEQLSQQLDDLGFRLSRQSAIGLNTQQMQLSALMQRLQLQHPQARHTNMQERLTVLTKRLQAQLPSVRQKQIQLTGLQQRLQRSNQIFHHQQSWQLATLASRLDMASPLKTLERGYAIASDKAGKVLTDTSTVNAGDQVSVRLHKGTLVTTVEK